MSARQAIGHLVVLTPALLCVVAILCPAAVFVAVLSVILVGVGVLISLTNWLVLLGSFRHGLRPSSCFPGPSLLTTLGLALSAPTRPYCWVGLCTDCTLFSLLFAAPFLIAETWRHSSFTRLQLLVADDGPRHFTLSLHRSGCFLLRGGFDPGVRSDAHGSLVSAFGAPGRWEETSAGCLRLWYYRGEREPSFALSLQATRSVREATRKTHRSRTIVWTVYSFCVPAELSPRLVDDEQAKLMVTQRRA